MFSNNHHNDGHVAVVVPAAIGIQAALIEAAPEKFYRPAYVGVRGWVGIEVDQVTDEELKLHIYEAWKLIAPAKLQNAFELDGTESLNAKSEAKEFLIPSEAKRSKVVNSQKRRRSSKSS